MSAELAAKLSFTLFNRNDDDIVKARPFNGDHKQIIAEALDETKAKHSATIEALAKI